MKTKEPICPYCGEKFERPFKHRTETEECHVNGCNLKDVKERIAANPNMEDYEKLMIEDELEYLSKVSSFGASRKNIYMERMIECNKLLKELREEK